MEVICLGGIMNKTGVLRGNKTWSKYNFIGKLTTFINRAMNKKYYYIRPV